MYHTYREDEEMLFSGEMLFGRLGSVMLGIGGAVMLHNLMNPPAYSIPVYQNPSLYIILGMFCLIAKTLIESKEIKVPLPRHAIGYIMPSMLPLSIGAGIQYLLSGKMMEGVLMIGTGIIILLFLAAKDLDVLDRAMYP